MRFRRQLWPVIAVAVVILGFSPQVTFAQGVDDPNGVFQLEGNAFKDDSICFPSLATPSPGCPAGDTLVTFGPNTDDWSNFTHAEASTGIVTDVSGHGDTILTGGGTKDINDFSSWGWKQTANTSVQAKDDITHAYAAAYTLSNGHTAIIFGMDRFDNSGDATAGFWFLQDSTVATNSSGGFDGHHMDGDLLIVSDFSTGGAVSTINVFTWSGGGLVLNESRSPAPCDPRPSNAPFSELCAIVNPVDGIQTPWGFLNKSSQTTLAHGEFLEGGIDLQSVFGNNVPCFTTFMAETRSSTSPSSTLSDFSGPVSFPLCGISVAKSCNGPGTVSADGTSITYTWTATATNTGIGTLTNVTINDTYPDGTTASISTTPSSLGAGASGTATITFIATNSNCHSGVTNCPSPLDATNTATAQGTTAGGVVITSPAPAATARCQTTVGSSVIITKACNATLVSQSNQVVVEVFFTADVTNNGSSQLTNVTLADDPAATITPNNFTLDRGQTQHVTGFYFPSGPAPGSCNFSDQIRVTAATATLGGSPTPATGCPSPTDLACAPATCRLCPQP